MSIVRYWWTFDGDEELCYRRDLVSKVDIRCDHCGKLVKSGSDMCELEPMRKGTQYGSYFMCKECADDNTETVPGRRSIDYNELISVLHLAEDVKDIDAHRYEIAQLMPSVQFMFNYIQYNKAHEYELWMHSLHTVINLGIDMDDDMLYLAALLHDIGKPECQCKSGREGDTDMHYYGHPIKSMEIVRDEVIPCLQAAGVELSEDDKKRLLYYVEYHDYRMSHREKHLKKHLGMVPMEWFKGLMLLQIADAEAHIQLPKIEERKRICMYWYNRVSASE